MPVILPFNHAVACANIFNLFASLSGKLIGKHLMMPRRLLVQSQAAAIAFHALESAIGKRLPVVNIDVNAFCSITVSDELPIRAKSLASPRLAFAEFLA